MKKERDMYFENQGYFSNPMMPMYPQPNMYTNNMMQASPMPNVPFNNMNVPQTLPNFPSNQGFNPNQDYNSMEQRINRLEKQVKRLDSRVARLESKCNIDTSSYQTTNDGYTINETNMYMM